MLCCPAVKIAIVLVSQTLNNIPLFSAANIKFVIITNRSTSTLRNSCVNVLLF